MKKVRRCFNLKNSGTGKGKGIVDETAVSTGSDDEDTSFTLNMETFTFQELSDATTNFSDNLRIGSGGSAIVYEGHLPSIGEVAVNAVKRLSYGTDITDTAHLQRGFLREVFVLNSMNHPNIVRLFGCCSEGRERLLVYEYVSQGPLRKCLSGLDWQKKMNIALGAAMGLQKLHVQTDPPVIHRDFKSDNILLRTVGYMAPEVASSAPPSIWSDIYSFGVALLELITGAKAVDSNRQGNEMNLAYWAESKLKDQNFEELLDPTLPGCAPSMASSPGPFLSQRSAL